MIKKTIQQLEKENRQLNQEKELLRVYLHELIEAFYKTVNKVEKEEKTLKFCAKCPKLTPPLEQCFLSNLNGIFCNQEDIGKPNYPKGGKHE